MVMEAARLMKRPPPMASPSGRTLELGDEISLEQRLATVINSFRGTTDGFGTWTGGAATPSPRYVSMCVARVSS